MGLSNYLSNEKKSLVVAATDIEGGNGLPLGSNSILEQFKRFIKAVKL